ncbi:hypothetical protein D3C73_604610 [compost metagenome]
MPLCLKLALCRACNELKVEYYENQGDARVVLMWESPSQVKSVIPAGAFYLP